MLDRLTERQIPGGATLRDALAFIAAMHAVGLEFLSRPVLASALGCPLERLRTSVLLPLGEEAATTTSSEAIFTRHPRIAQAILTVLNDDYGEDTDNRYVDLAEAAIDAFMKGGYVPQLRSWRFRLPDHFFEAGRRDLGIAIAKAVVSRNPLDPRPLVNLAQLYRKASTPELALQLFRNLPVTYPMDRVAFHEWSNCAGFAGNDGDSVLLSAYSLADQSETIPPDNDQAKMVLASLGAVLGKLFEAYHEQTFNDARAAVAVLGSQLKLDTLTATYFDNHLRHSLGKGGNAFSIEEAVAALKQAVIIASAYSSDDVVLRRTGDLERMTFSGLARLIRNSSKLARLRQSAEEQT